MLGLPTKSGGDDGEWGLAAATVGGEAAVQEERQWRRRLFWGCFGVVLGEVFFWKTWL